MGRLWEQDSKRSPLSSKYDTKEEAGKVFFIYGTNFKKTAPDSQILVMPDPPPPKTGGRGGIYTYKPM